MKKLFLYLIIITESSLSFLNAQEDPQKIRAYRIKNISVDGVLNEKVYNYPPVTKFTQREPDRGKPSSEKNNAWIFYNDNYLFVCGKMYDSHPDSIDVSLARRDNNFDSDMFWFFVDPYHDKKTGYVFVVTAGGSILDGTIFNDTQVDFLWDGIWETKTQVDSEGWNFEMKIPFSQLRFNKSDNMIWGVNLNRDIKRKKEQSFTTMIPKEDGAFISKFGELVGLKGIQPKQRFEALPYFVNKIEDVAHDANDPFFKENLIQTSFGADIKFGLGSNLTIDAAINPDFGQVEVDPAVVNLTAFETFFDEKRPFFIEGSNIFSFGRGGANKSWEFDFGSPQLFYSRRIGRQPQGKINSNGFVNIPKETKIAAAVKLTGKIDETWSIGALSALTERTFAQIQKNNNVIGIASQRTSQAVEPQTFYSVFRTQKEFNEGKQALGLISTAVNRNISDVKLKTELADKAFTLGLDGWTYLDKDEIFILTGSFINSYTHGTEDYLIKLQQQPYRYFQRPDASHINLDSSITSLTGWYSRLALNKQKGNFYLNASLGAISPQFEYNDLGSQWFGDKINGSLVLGYQWFLPDNIFRKKNIYLASFRNYDFGGTLLENGISASSNLEFLNYYGINVNAQYNFEGFNRTLTRGGPLTKDPEKFNLNISGFSDSRRSIIFSPQANYWEDTSGSNGYTFGFDVEWKPNSQIYFSIGPEYSNDFDKRQWIGNFSDALAKETFNTRYIFGELNQKSISAKIRLNWTFTPSVSLQLFVQPLIAVGDYNNFKELAEKGSMHFNIYGKNNSTISYNETDRIYTVDPEGNGNSQIIFDNPDFNFKSFRGNVVLRIEASPGSTFYLVWTRDKMNYDNPGNLNFQRDLKNLWDSASNDIFLIKFSLWFDTHSI